MANELYAFHCKECDFIYLEPYNPSDRFAEFPQCSDCGSDDVEIYEGELSDELRKAVDEYTEEHGTPE